jgi:hypothetical protein
MPSLQKLLQRLSGQPFAILGVNYGESRSRIDGFVGSMPLTFPILRDPRHEPVTAWRVRTVGPDGRVRYWVVGELTGRPTTSLHGSDASCPDGRSR